MTPPAPDLIPGYRIVRELGLGGMASVYLAVQESLGREVALKLLAPRLAEDPVAAERFMREARTAARLVHRHIVGIYDVGIHDGQPYLSMEFLPGGSVAEHAARPGRGPADRSRDRARARPRPPPGRRASRHQAGKHPAPRRWLLRAGRFRHRPHHRCRRRDDPGRHDPGHAQLHEPGTIAGQGTRWPRRPVQPGRRALPVAHRRAAVQGHRRLERRHAAHQRALPDAAARHSRATSR